MTDYLQSRNVLEKKIHINGIPTILLKPRESKGLLATILFYHGWSSDKESQRIRGFLLANLGYQVAIPDAMYHGERNPVNHQRPENVEKYFWATIFQNIKESDGLIEELIKKYDADPKATGVIGNSMGGFTSAGIFTHNPDIKALVVLNGSCYWKDSNEFFLKSFQGAKTDEILELEEAVDGLDPMNNLEKLKNRPILMLHGVADEVVPAESQRKFYSKINPMYDHRPNLKLVRYPDLNHFVTTNMMEEAIIWFHKHLKK